MSLESSKKWEPRVIQNNGVPAEGKQNGSDSEKKHKYYSEESEVDLWDPGGDCELYKHTCQELWRLMAEIQDLKSRGSKDAAVEIERQKIQSCVHFMTLKKLNRLAHIRLEKGRAQTQKAKQKVDAYHLQLQNLIYEMMHLQKEMTKCLGFKSKHEEIDLVSLEEFYKEAPPDISKAEITMGDPHQQMLACLEWELEQQKRLAEKYRECLSNKEKILKETEMKKKYLSSLQPCLNSIRQASLPVQEYRFLPFDQAHQQSETARHLPSPLYVLFVQATAYGEACDKMLSVAIEGSVAEAKALLKPKDFQDDESNPDAEEEHTSKCQQSMLKFQLNDKSKEMLRRHLLSIKLDLKCKDDSVLHLTFYYLINLNIMTVKAEVTTATELITPISAGDLLSADSVLSCLYPEDHGGKNPNPANQHWLDQVGIPILRDYVLDLGHPCLWVQKLGGLHFPKEQSQHTEIVDSSLSSSHMEKTMKLLKTRVVSHLVKWMTIAREDYVELHFTKDVVEVGLAGDTSLYYMALTERGTAKLQAAVVLNPGYSSIPPIFRL
ncbi:THO complex subunit 5 like protein [Tupaia chinensis]|uniref:THO complex subunit 5 like protein n=1 Tax=Tupaia chinensis TaxID=246437 RepID=L9L8Y5_TUPCH|nr:THO complex subunit 5 like protein [Tupaia chinensis]